MTPEEKTQVLGTIEKLMNHLWLESEISADDFGKIMNKDFPNVIWHWNHPGLPGVIATDFIQKEI